MSVIGGAGTAAAVPGIETDPTANQSDAECAHASLHRGLTAIRICFDTDCVAAVG